MRKLLLVSSVAALLGAVYYSHAKRDTLTVYSLNHDASALDGQTVEVRGFVIKNASILNTGGFVLGDGRSEVLVLSKNGVPKFEREVTVTGIFRKAISLNNFEYNIIYQAEGDESWGS